ncbi:MAG: sugar phosphate isomerase/epimerase [Anaerolineales bacterium]|nr:sugar phosphate isomerase/epimerase [Anaerolineales bacterium]
MRIKGIGIDAHSPRLDGSLEVLEHDLTFFQRVGFDYVEIPVHGVDAILGGRLHERRVKEVQEIVGKLDLKYTVHSPDPLDLCDVERPDLQKAVFRSSLEFAQAIGAGIMVYHGGATNPPNNNEEAGLSVERLKEVEREALSELADDAAALGVVIGVENVGPRSYSARIAELVEQVRKINHPNVGITLDFGHAYLTARHLGYDFLEAIELAAPDIVHVHVHDNFGRVVSLPQDAPYIHIAPFGVNDMHLPPGWGEIPYREVFSRLKDYQGVALMELKPRYSPYFEEALQETRRLLAECGVE